MSWKQKPRQEFCNDPKRHGPHKVRSPKTGKVLYYCPGVN